MNLPPSNERTDSTIEPSCTVPVHHDCTSVNPRHAHDLFSLTAEGFENLPVTAAGSNGVYKKCDRGDTRVCSGTPLSGHNVKVAIVKRVVKGHSCINVQSAGVWHFTKSYTPF